MGRRYKNAQNKNNQQKQRGGPPQPVIPKIPYQIKEVIYSIVREAKEPMNPTVMHAQIEKRTEAKFNPTEYGFNNFWEALQTVTNRLEFHIMGHEEALINPQVTSVANYAATIKCFKTIPVNPEYSLKLHPESAQKKLSGRLLPERAVKRIIHLLVNLFPLGVPGPTLFRIYSALFGGGEDLNPKFYGFRALDQFLMYEDRLFRRLFDDEDLVVAASFDETHQKALQRKMSEFPFGAVTSSFVPRSLRWEDFTKIGEKHCVTVGDFMSDTDFCVHLERDTYSIARKTIEERIFSFYDIKWIRNMFLCHDKNFKRGQVLCVPVTGHWYRARFICKAPDDMIKVALMDHGGHELVHEDLTYHLYEQFAHLPAQALKVRLRGLEPKESLSEHIRALVRDKLLELEIKNIGDGLAVVDLYFINQNQSPLHYVPARPDSRTCVLKALLNKGICEHRKPRKDILMDRCTLRRFLLEPIQDDS